MREYILGETVPFSQVYYDGNGDLYDPAEVTLKIVRSGTIIVYGPYYLTSAEVENISTGVYSKDILFDDFLVPGIYAARWEADVEGTIDYYYDYVLIKEEPPLPNELLDPPRKYGIMRTSHMYQTMGMRTTDITFLLGHADGLGLNDPYEVRNMQEAINILGGDDQSPLARALLEAYNAGARDLYLVAVAPMSEWVEYDLQDPTLRFQSRDEWGGLNFYQRYIARMETTVNYLKEWDLPEVIAPIDLPYFYTEGYNWDVLSLFGDLLASYIDSNIAPPIIILGSRLGEWTTSQVQQAIDEKAYYNDAEIGSYLDYWSTYWPPERQEEFYTKSPNKYFFLVWGECTMSTPQLPRSYVTSPIAAVAGAMSAAPLDRSMTWLRIPGIISPMGRDLTPDEVIQLSRKHINALVRTTRGKRGTPFETVLASDNTDAFTGSTFWAVVQLRLAVKVAKRIERLGRMALGSVQYALFKNACEEFMEGLVRGGMIRDYSLNIYRETDADQTVKVNVGIAPFVGVREIYFTVEVGPQSPAGSI